MSTVEDKHFWSQKYDLEINEWELTSINADPVTPRSATYDIWPNQSRLHWPVSSVSTRSCFWATCPCKSNNERQKFVEIMGVRNKRRWKMEQYSQEQRAVEKLSTQLLGNVSGPVLLAWGNGKFGPSERDMLLHQMPNCDTWSHAEYRSFWWMRISHLNAQAVVQKTLFASNIVAQKGTVGAQRWWSVHRVEYLLVEIWMPRSILQRTLSIRLKVFQPPWHRIFGAAIIWHLMAHYRWPMPDVIKERLYG